MGSFASECVSQRRERVRRRRVSSEWVGMDFEPLRASSRLPAVSVLRRLFRQLLRRHALCDEGWVATHGTVHAPPIFPELVPAALPICLRGIQDCFMLTNTIVADVAADFAADIRAGLTKAGQKELPSKYLYDTLGSKLFDVIVELPEYGLTRADERLLRGHAHEIVRRIPGDVILCELGSGSGRKTRWVLEALSRRRHTSYFPIEISPAALDVCRRERASRTHLV